MTENYAMHLMSAPRRNSFVFLWTLNRTNYFLTEQTLSVLLYSDERKINKIHIHTTTVFRDKNSTINDE